jgi:hypothetical protein
MQALRLPLKPQQFHLVVSVDDVSYESPKRVCIDKCLLAKKKSIQLEDKRYRVNAKEGQVHLTSIQANPPPHILDLMGLKPISLETLVLRLQ